ncbi:HlyD family secretion protein [Bremerella volcania]|uniref:HlyD family secretion protein n=1 Tax=Bremerella volcania TaxID=2527984 RepID=A0A518C295_9BACT|nr:HlyD family efflux transporter periplasmic adaptor subunit [Bremerella volcania]QDU73332.1 HlyD family secretion protein [Bremerella volcania]
MPRTILLRIALFLSLAIAIGLIGYYTGMQFAPAPAPPTEAAQDDHEDEHGHDHGSGEVVELTDAAFNNLKIAVKTMRGETYVAPLTIPGEVVEIPGRSSFTVAAPVGGNIRSVNVDAGQLVHLSDALFTLDIVDEPVLSAQVDLLDVLGQIDVTKAEINRLSPLAQSGAIAGKTQLEFQYQEQKLQNRKDARIQELIARGLTANQVSHVIEQRKLIKQIDVLLSEVPRVDDSSEQDPVSFVVESLEIHPGMTVERGTSLARLADHRYLYIRGEAFEQDVPRLYELEANHLPIEVQFGHSHQDAAHRNYATRTAEIAYIDNHADETTGTFFFYLRIKNEVAADSLLLDQSVTRQWRFKPGQRVHLQLPMDKYEDQFVLPREALVEEGIETFVFQQVFGHVEPAMKEFQKVPVEVIHRDTNTAVIRRDGDIRLGDTIVVTHAYQLYLEMLSKAGSGGGSDHHGHNH